MGPEALNVRRVECETGKKKTVVREREYELTSWAGIKLIVSVAASTILVISGVLFTYYSAEAGQSSRIGNQETSTGVQEQRLDDNDRRLNETFEKFHDTLDKQQQVLTDNTNRLIRQDQQLNDNERRLNETFLKFDETLNKQQQTLDANTKAIIRIGARQEALIQRGAP